MLAIATTIANTTGRFGGKLTQTELARLLKSSQSRVAKIEAGDATVSLAVLVRSLIAMGATRRELARVIGCD